MRHARPQFKAESVQMVLDETSSKAILSSSGRGDFANFTIHGVAAISGFDGVVVAGE